MAALPQPEVSMIDTIYAAIEKKEEKSELYLARLGASGIGDECLRSIWLSWRAYDDKKFGGRMLRLFRTGHLQEDRIIADLKLAGYQVWDRDENGNQPTFNDETGHFVCKLDGVIKGVPGSEKTPHDLEIKTHSLKSFEDVKKKGVQVSKPGHYWQMQAGMLFGGFTRALYVALCKNDEDYHIERIRPDAEVQNAIQRKIIKLVEARTPPIGISDDQKAFGCRWCDMKEVCSGDKKPIRTCRSCIHADVIPQGGRWGCGHPDGPKTGQELNQDTQREGCLCYEVIS